MSLITVLNHRKWAKTTKMRPGEAIWCQRNSKNLSRGRYAPRDPRTPLSVYTVLGGLRWDIRKNYLHNRTSYLNEQNIVPIKFVVADPGFVLGGGQPPRGAKFASQFSSWGRHVRPRPPHTRSAPGVSSSSSIWIVITKMSKKHRKWGQERPSEVSEIYGCA